MGSVDLSKLGYAPPGFDWVQGTRGVLLCRSGYAGALEQAGFSRDALFADESLPDAQESGKEPLGKLGLAAVGGRAPVDCLVRRFSHGGLARAFTGRRFRDPARPFEELRLSEALHRHGIPTARVVAARAVRHRFLGYELALVTERLPGRVDVGMLIGRVRRGEAPRKELRRALVQSARIIGAMHGVGFRHSDLQPANLLVPVDGGGAARRGLGASGAAVLDLDRSEFVPNSLTAQPLPEPARWKNLGRLWRHVQRREKKYGVVFTPADLTLFLMAYGVPKDLIPAAAVQIEAAAKSNALLHRAGWVVQSLLGRGRDARAAASSRS